MRERVSAGGLLMVVDDDAGLRESIATLLTGRGFRVSEHASGQTALDALSRGELPDLIVLDLMMPQMDGWEFRQRQLANAAIASIPVIAVSGDPTAKAAIADAAAFMAKPLAAADLLSTVEDVLTKDRENRRTNRAASRWSPSWRKQARRRHARPWQASARRTLPMLIEDEEQRRQQLAYVSCAVSHLVNNALQGLLSYAQCAAGPGAEEFDIQRSAVASALGCAEVLRRFADCTRREEAFGRSGAPLAQVPIDLLQSWRDACPPEVDLRVTGLQSLTAACVAPHVLADLMSELIANAVEAFGGMVGTVHIRISHQARRLRDLGTALPVRDRRAGHWCCIEVSDNGPGIRASELPRIWWPFYTTKFAGRGLGLALVLARVCALAGLVEAESAPGRGTTIRLLLPL